MWLKRRQAKRAPGNGAGPVPPWLGPLPTGPVVFDPSLRRAGELVGRSGRPPAPTPPPPADRQGHAA